MPFPFYERLSTRNKAIYRRSAAIREVPLGDVSQFAELVTAIRRALEADDKGALQRASAALVRGLCTILEVKQTKVRVLARRPSDENAELHGLYTLDGDGTALIRVWMRTAAWEQPVAFRTYLRTLLHELAHHLDFHKYGLEESFHTEGFYARESSLARQMLATIGETANRREPRAKPKPKGNDRQTSLFGDDG